MTPDKRWALTLGAVIGVGAGSLLGTLAVNYDDDQKFIALSAPLRSLPGEAADASISTVHRFGHNRSVVERQALTVRSTNGQLLRLELEVGDPGELSWDGQGQVQWLTTDCAVSIKLPD